MGSDTTSRVKLSVIIPAYNASEYIECCLQSLMRQSVPQQELEILVVNDGSTDNTKEIVTALAVGNPHIHLINQANKGNGGARNTGIDHATGSYIYFLDSDDYIANDTLKKLLDLAFENNLDILGFKSKKVNTSKYRTSDVNQISDQGLDIFTGTQFIGKHNYEAEVWWYFVRRSFLLDTKLRFYDRKFVQDSYLTPTLFSQASKVTHVEMDVHRYRMSQNSITRSTSTEHLKRHFSDLIFAVTKLEELIVKLGKDLKVEDSCIHMLRVKKERYVLITMVRFIKSELPFASLKEYLSAFRVQNAYPMAFFPKTKGYDTFLNRLLVFVFNRKSSLRFFFRVYRVFKGRL